MPSRPLETIIDVLLRAYPAKTRAERERMQADEIYKAGAPLRVCATKHFLSFPTSHIHLNLRYRLQEKLLLSLI